MLHRIAIKTYPIQKMNLYLHLPQIALPPQTESMSTPKLRAALSTDIPFGKCPLFPEGIKTTRTLLSVLLASLCFKGTPT